MVTKWPAFYRHPTVALFVSLCLWYALFDPQWLRLILRYASWLFIHFRILRDSVKCMLLTHTDIRVVTTISNDFYKTKIFIYELLRKPKQLNIDMRVSIISLRRGQKVARLKLRPMKFTLHKQTYWAVTQYGLSCGLISPGLLEYVEKCVAGIQSVALTQPQPTKKTATKIYGLLRNFDSDMVMFHAHVRTWTVFRYPVYPATTKAEETKVIFFKPRLNIDYRLATLVTAELLNMKKTSNVNLTFRGRCIVIYIVIIKVNGRPR